MGAKIISSYYEQNKITKQQAKKMLSFCSISGPMFMVGTVGIGILCSFKAGLVILISNLIAALINGLIHKNKQKDIVDFEFNTKQKKFNLSDIMLDSLNSILMVGGFLVLSFLLIDTLIESGVLSFILNTISCVSNELISEDLVQAFACGLIEITRGIIDISSTTLDIKTQTILSSGLIGFGGFSIILQSMTFLKKIDMKFSEILIQKITQGILAIVVSIILVFVVF